MMMLIPTLLLAFLTAPLAQDPVPTVQAEEKPFSKPFRFHTPTKDVELSRDLLKLLSDLNDLKQNWDAAKDRGFDDDGRPHSEGPHFVKLRGDLMQRLSHQGGHLRWILLDDRSPARRSMCYFAALLLPEKQDALHLFRYLPYEPSTAVRRDAIDWSLPFLRKHVAIRQEGATGRPEHYTFQFEILPWIDLTRAPNAADRVLGLEVCSIVARARPELAPEALRVMRGWLPDNLRSEHRELAAAAREWIRAVEPEARVPDEGDAAVAYLGRVLRKLFPDVRLQGGLCELYPGPDLDRIVTLGTELLESSRLGILDEIEIRTDLGVQRRTGLRLWTLPDELRKLGLDQGDLLVAVNGQPVTGCAQLLEILVDGRKAGRTQFVLEWVAASDKSEHARRYVLRPRKDD